MQAHPGLPAARKGERAIAAFKWRFYFQEKFYFVLRLPFATYGILSDEGFNDLEVLWISRWDFAVSPVCSLWTTGAVGTIYKIVNSVTEESSS